MLLLGTANTTPTSMSSLLLLLIILSISTGMSSSDRVFQVEDGKRLSIRGTSNASFASDNDSDTANSNSNSNPNPNNENRTATPCDRIHPENLPEECTCSNLGPVSLEVMCLKIFNDTFFNDTIGMKILVDPCNPEGAKVTMDVLELNHGIDIAISKIEADDEVDIPIPGLAVVVPHLGHAGIDVALLVSGNIDALTLKIGLNACMITPTHKLCASQIPGLNWILPWYVLHGTYSFGDICGHKNMTSIGTTTTATTSDGSTDSHHGNSNLRSHFQKKKQEKNTILAANNKKETYEMSINHLPSSLSSWMQQQQQQQQQEIQ